MRTTFATARGAKRAATSVIVTVTLASGRGGVGEVPTSFVMPHETVPAIQGVLRAARTALVGRTIAEYPAALEILRGEHGEFRMTLAGLEVALFRASLAAEGVSELAYWHRMAREGGSSALRASTQPTSVETDITIPFTRDDDELDAWLTLVAPVGFRTYKIKVSGEVETDLHFVAAVRRWLEEKVPGFVIRLDGNQGYTAASYARMLRGLQKAGTEIELFEQPLHKDDFASLKKIRGLSSVPVILDETVCDEQACRRVIDENLGDGVNIKIAKSGIAGSAAILRLAKQAGLKLMIGCMTETMVGLSAGIALAAGTGAFDYIDLDSIHFLHRRSGFGSIQPCGPRYVLGGAE